MAVPKISDGDFVVMFRELGPFKFAERLGQQVSSVFQRRKRLEKKMGIRIDGPKAPQVARNPALNPQRVHLEIESGHVLIGSDLHLWPGIESTSLRAFIKLCSDVKPKAVILNGDVLDFPQISAHPPISWESHPTVQQEIENAQDRLGDIERAAGRAHKEWTLGNHDARFEKRIASVAPEFAKIAGVHLKDHFPLWRGSYSVWINDNTIVKHRFKGGIHATHNNAVSAGKHIVTGHLHSAKVTPFTDYNGTRYGVDTGCMCDPDGAQFLYTEDNPKNWREAFALLTFHKSKLLMPELILVHDKDHIEFRGQVMKV